MNEIKLKITIDGKEAVASLQLTDANVKQLYNSFKYGEQEVHRFTTSISQGFNNAREIIGGVQSVLSVFKTTFSEPYSLYIEAEQANASFKVLLGSAEKAKSMLEELRDFGARTPLEFKDLRENAKLLLNFGIEAGNVLPYLRMLGDISGGNAQKMGSLTLAFAQASSAGRLMGQDLLQMINAGFNPLQTMSEKTGKSMAHLKKDMEKGNITFKEVTQAFVDATSKGGKFFNMLETQAGTSGGALSNFNDAITVAQTETGKLVAEALTPLLRNVSGIISELNTLNPSLVGIIGLTGSLTATFVTLRVTGILPATTAIKAFFASLGPIGWAVTGISTLAAAFLLLRDNTDAATDAKLRYDSAFSEKKDGKYFSSKAMLMNKKQLEESIKGVEYALSSGAFKEGETDVIKITQLYKEAKLELMAYKKVLKEGTFKKDLTSNQDLKKKKEEQEKLSRELSLNAKEGRERDLADAKFKYEENLKVAKGNNALLLLVEEDYRRERIKINKKYNEIERKLMNELLENAKKLPNRYNISPTEIGVTGSESIDIEKIKNDNKIGDHPLAYMFPEKEDPIERIIKRSDPALGAIEVLKDAYNSLGSTMAGVWSSQVQLIKNNNSMLQQAINYLGQYATQLLTLSIFKGALSLIDGKGFLSGFMNALFAADGAVVTKPTLAVIGEGREPEGVFPLSYLNNMMSTRPQVVYVQIEPVELKARGMDLRSVIKQTEHNVKKRR